MKVILLEDVKKVGKRNEIVEVSDGYANNFLIRQKKAKEVTKSNLKELNNILDNLEKDHQELVSEANKMKKSLENKVFEFTLHLGNKGQLFGKISTKQIAKKLQEEGFNVDRKKIKTEGINHLGEETIDIELHKEVIAKVKINIIGE